MTEEGMCFRCKRNEATEFVQEGDEIVFCCLKCYDELVERCEKEYFKWKKEKRD